MRLRRARTKDRYGRSWGFLGWGRGTIRKPSHASVHHCRGMLASLRHGAISVLHSRYEGQGFRVYMVQGIDYHLDLVFRGLRMILDF